MKALAQIPCVKPDAGADQSTTQSSFKLKDAPAGYFWCMPSGNPVADATIHAQTGAISGMRTPGTYRFVLSSIAHSMNLHADRPIESDGPLRSNTLTGLEMLDNGQIKVGVDGRYGGAITYLSTKTGVNMVNNYDLGRQIQVAAYSGPVPFKPAGFEIKDVWSQIGWNPLQAGDYYGNPGRILAFEKRDNLLYVKTAAKFWPLRNYEEGTIIEHWVRLAGPVVKVHVRVTLGRNDKTQFTAREQEFPCLYLNGAYRKAWGYTGTQPFTNGDKYQRTAPFELANVKVSEPWMALTRDDGTGVGLYSPNNLFFKEGFFGDEFTDNEFGSSTSYIAATPFAQLDHNSVTDFDYELVVGHVNDIRAYVYAQPRPDTGPNYRFSNSRAGWHLFEGNDTGFPISNKVQIVHNGQGSQLFKSPAVHWKGSDNPKVYVRAAFNLNNNQTKYQFHWRNFEDTDFLGFRFKEFTVVNDNQFRTYEIDLRNTNWASSIIRQIQLTPPAGSQTTGSVQIEWISTNPDGPPQAQPEAPATVCTDTVLVTVNPAPSNVVPDAGPDITTRCGITTLDLTAPSAGLSWRMISKPSGSLATITPKGAVRELQKAGTYVVALANDTFSAVDLMAITVPDCGPPQSLSSVVFLDNGRGNGIARNGRQEPGEPGVPNVTATLYSDPNGDGNPADGKILDRVRTNAQGVYQFNSLYANEIYIIALDASNFVAGQPLHRTISTRQSNFSPVYGLLSGKIQLQNPAPAAPSLRALAPAQSTDPSFGLIPDCGEPSCVIIRHKRLQ
ncbi:hypothetical protein [Rudanella lutea]|uniref:hypothetical protein n=1 Tax=Rudanella lutea TaxID=451374 RepID=UPI00035D8CA9|nr:hypothetical protein [Rudanella lutea]